MASVCISSVSVRLSATDTILISLPDDVVSFQLPVSSSVSITLNESSGGYTSVVPSYTTLTPDHVILSPPLT